MDDNALIRMSRQIAEAQLPYGEHAAVDRCADHIRMFWEPRMRQRLLDLHARCPDRLHRVVRAATEKLRTT